MHGVTMILLMHGVTMILLMHDVTMILLMHGVTMILLMHGVTMKFTFNLSFSLNLRDQISHPNKRTDNIIFM